ncbi:hypothetical protein JVU11DRAFT_8542 [Chiua virens]|nr:hypothetical protein JVU11DRAFT_8542 [Chiua virens]
MTASDPSSHSSSHGSVFQNSFYIGNNLENILYGIELVLYFKTMRVLLTATGRARKRSNIFYVAFSSIMLFLVTIWVASGAIFGEKMWIIDARYPGGLDQYWKTNISVWYMDCGTTAVILLQLMTDGLMIYRCRVVWNSHRVIVIPILLWLISFALGITVDWATSTPGGDFFTGLASQLGFAYYTISVVLNTTLTCMICYRMVRHGKEVQQLLGYEYASLYFSVVTLIVESVLPYTVTGIAFLVSLGISSSTSIGFVSVYFLMMCISPQMLILRVITRKAWDDHTFRQPGSTLKFSPESTGTTTLPFNTNETKTPLQTLSNVYLPESKV